MWENTIRVHCMLDIDVKSCYHQNPRFQLSKTNLKDSPEKKNRRMHLTPDREASILIIYNVLRYGTCY